jgi:AMMECR1 domain-containing protein
MALTSPSPPEFDDKDRRELLRIARATIREHFLTGDLPPGAPHRQPLLEPCGAAVMIHREDSGLAGQALELAPTEALYLTVEKLTVEAILRAEIAPDEIPSIKIAIALLSPLSHATEPTAIVPGLHGVVVTRGPRRGIVLPDPTRDAEALLDDACAHAAMPPGAWRDPRVEVAHFAAIRFFEG